MVNILLLSRRQFLFFNKEKLFFSNRNARNLILNTELSTFCCWTFFFKWIFFVLFFLCSNNVSLGGINSNNKNKKIIFKKDARLYQSEQIESFSYSRNRTYVRSVVFLLLFFSCFLYYIYYVKKHLVHHFNNDVSYISCANFSHPCTRFTILRWRKGRTEEKNEREIFFFFFSPLLLSIPYSVHTMPSIGSHTLICYVLCCLLCACCVEQNSIP